MQSGVYSLLKVTVFRVRPRRRLLSEQEQVARGGEIDQLPFMAHQDATRQLIVSPSGAGHPWHELVYSPPSAS